RVLLFCLLLGCAFQLQAQQLVKTFDSGLWTGLKIDYKLKNNFKLVFMQDLRLSDNFSKLNKVNTDLGVQYKINKNFKLATNIRYSYNLRKLNLYSHDLRMNYDLGLKIKIVENLKLRYRLRFQHAYITEFNFSGYGYNGIESNLRNKLQFDYSIEDHQIYLNAELFREMKPSRLAFFNQMRFILGSKWKNKLGEFNYALAYERELGKANPLNYVFLKLYYTFEFEQKIKNKRTKK
ncbi:MAG: DUF2490 domain-containing protein, partial [Chitinophagales bacterium]